MRRSATSSLWNRACSSGCSRWIERVGQAQVRAANRSRGGAGRAIDRRRGVIGPPGSSGSPAPCACRGRSSRCGGRGSAGAPAATSRDKKRSKVLRCCARQPHESECDLGSDSTSLGVNSVTLVTLARSLIPPRWSAAPASTSRPPLTLLPKAQDRASLRQQAREAGTALSLALTCLREGFTEHAEELPVGLLVVAEQLDAVVVVGELQ